jgi:CBS domain-containing protein
VKISDVLASKDRGREVVSIAPDAGVRDLLALLAEHNVGAVVVSADGSTLDGIVSERDVVRHLHHDGTVVNNTVRAIMTREVEVCRPDAGLDEVMEIMTRRRFRHLPVVGEQGLEGVVSIGDVVKAKIGQLEFERDQLDSYVHQT